MASPVRNPDYDWGDIVPPWVYAREVLGLDPYQWQDDVWDAVGQRIPCAVAAANESGKTTFCAAPLILWFLDQFGACGGKVVITSGSWLQLTTQFAPAIRRYKHLYPTWEWNDTTIRIPGSPADYGLIMFSTDTPGRAEGHHAVDKINAPLFIIADESKTIPDGIFTAFDRCGPQYLLLMSSPGHSSGKFYRCFHKERKFYWTKRVTSSECAHIEPEKRERDRDLYGEDSVMFLSMHGAEFTDIDGKVVFAPSKVRACQEKPPKHEPGLRIAFCDFAAGGDENVLAIRDGNKVEIVAAWHEEDTTQGARQFIELFKKYGLNQSEIYGDADGLGHAMIKTMADEGWHIHSVHNNAAPQDTHYANLSAEQWHTFAAEIGKKEWILPDDPVFFDQLTTRRVHLRAKGKLGVEPKEDMAERGLGSPDRADAVIGATQCGPHMGGAIASTSGIRFARSTFARPSLR